MKKFPLCLALGASVFMVTACASHDAGTYRGGVLVQPAPLDIQDHYSFRFADKWRISHQWLSGDVEIEGCQGYLLNPFRLKKVKSELENERNSPFVERNGKLYRVVEHQGKWWLSNTRQSINGMNRFGEFKGYSSFCYHGFKDSLDLINLFIVEPDSSKGTDEWIKGAKPITINGLNWLHKEIPMQDWSKSRERLSAPIEYWVLKIPDTPYWMMLRFSASSSSTDGLGALAHPEKHQRLLNLFHQIVKSVTLEPITPVNIDDLVKEVR